MMSPSTSTGTPASRSTARARSERPSAAVSASVLSVACEASFIPCAGQGRPPSCRRGGGQASKRSGEAGALHRLSTSIALLECRMGGKQIRRNRRPFSVRNIRLTQSKVVDFMPPEGGPKLQKGKTWVQEKEGK